MKKPYDIPYCYPTSIYASKDFIAHGAIYNANNLKDQLMMDVFLTMANMHVREEFKGLDKFIIGNKYV